MKEFIEKLKSQKNLCLGEKADVHNNIAARKYLADEGMQVFPDEFFLFVKYINGILGDGSRLYGIDPEEKNSTNDAVYQNERLNRADKDKVAVLGYNTFDYLVYDGEANEYQLRDKADDVIVNSYDNLQAAITVLLGIR